MNVVVDLKRQYSKSHYIAAFNAWDLASWLHIVHEQIVPPIGAWIMSSSGIVRKRGAYLQSNGFGRAASESDWVVLGGEVF